MNQTTCPHCGKEIAILKAAPTSEPRTVQGTDIRSHEEPNDLKLVTCNRCGEGNLCWQESKNGKFYLARTRIENGRAIPLRKEFHQCTR